MALLSGLRVVELAHPLTEYAGLVLAGLGAEVLLIEPPRGTPMRRRAPFLPGADSSSRGSFAFLSRNAGKRSIAIDPHSAQDLRLLGDLLERADVVLDADASPYHRRIAAEGPASRITVTDPKGLGSAPIVGFAASGGLASSGWPHQPPCNAPGWLALDGTAIYAAILSVVALLARSRGAGRIDYEIPYQEAAVAALTPWTRCLHAYGTQAAGQGITTARLGAGPYAIYEARDGYVRMVLGTPKQWQAFVELLGRPAELCVDTWNDPVFRGENYDALVLICSNYTREMSVDELFHRGQSLGLTITPVNTLRGFLDDPHVRARGILVDVQDPEFGPMRLMRPPLVTEPEALVAAVTPAPALGEHDSLAREIAAEPPRPQPQVRAEIDPARPLAGLRILELGVGAVVPEAASFLALLGADVIKVESRVRVDFLRQMGLGGYMDVDNCPTFNQLNLGVRSLAVDMSTVAGRELVQRLVPLCDVVMENMRGPVVGNWGLDYAAARTLRPDIVYLSSQGLGRGPYDGYQTYGPNLQTFSGVTSQWAHPDDPYPVGTTLNHPDHVAGKQALVPLLAALLRRDAGQGGCFIEAAQFETPAYLIGHRLLAQQYADEDLPPLGNRSLEMAPHGCYRCADDAWIAIAVEDDRAWQALAEVIDEPWASQPAFGSAAGRLAAASEIDEALGAWTEGQGAAELEARLRAAGIAASRVITGDDMAADEAAHASGFFATVSHPTSGLRTYTGMPLIAKPGGRPPGRRPPLLGEHTDAVLFDLLRLGAAEAAALYRDKIVGY